MKKKLLTTLAFLLTVFSAVSAQTTSFPWDQIIGVAFIFIIVLILLALGGVFRGMHVGRGILGIIGMLILLALFFVVPAFVEYPQLWPIPDSFKYIYLGKGVGVILQAIGLPAEWAYVPAILYLLILPFAAIYTLVWGFLTSLGIFPQPNVNKVLALIIAFLTLPMGLFTKMVWILFSFMGAWSVAIFAAVFILGIFFRGYGIVREQYVRSLKTYENVGREIVDKLNALKRANLPTASDYHREIAKLADDYGPLYPTLRDLYAEVRQTDDVNHIRNLLNKFSLEKGVIKS